jgi:hypothetical protein
MTFDDEQWRFTAETLRISLKDLIDQIMDGPLIDPQGRDFRVNEAVIKSMRLLLQLQSGHPVLH